MPFPLAAVLAAAPSVISAAADIIRVIRENKSKTRSEEPVELPQPDTQRFDELTDLIERQAKVIEELALNNSNLALAVKNNRILAGVSTLTAIVALIVAVLF